MPDAHKNFAYSLVATAPSPADTGISLVVQSGDGAKFPTPPFNTTVWPFGDQPLITNAEIVRVTAISGDTLTITRAQEGTTARSILVGDQIAATITVKTLTDIEAGVSVASNLKIENKAGAMDTTVVVTADAITVQDVLVTSLNVEAAITASGAGGLDTGVEASATWYAIWLIAKQDGTVAALLSTSFGAPTMPSDYTKKRRVGAVRNDFNGNFYHLLQTGEIVHYTNPTHDSNNHRLINGGTNATFTNVDASKAAPPPTRLIWARSGIGTGPVASLLVRLPGAAVSLGLQVGIRNSSGSVQSGMWIPVSATQQFEYRFSSTGTGGAFMDCYGYIDPAGR